MRHLVPQVFGGASDVSVQVGHVNQLGDAGLSGCLGDLLRDGDIRVFEAVVTAGGERKVSMNCIGQVSSLKYLQMYI